MDTARKEWFFDTQSIAAATYHNCQNPWYCFHRTYNRLLNNLAIPIAWRRCSNLLDGTTSFKRKQNEWETREKNSEIAYLRKEKNKSARTRKSLSSISKNVCRFISPNSERTSGRVVSESFLGKHRCDFIFQGHFFPPKGIARCYVEAFDKYLHKHNVLYENEISPSAIRISWRNEMRVYCGAGRASQFILYLK